jgi:DNA polymerase I-like protein with 3'-5' exonuclease and polymerase domains
VARGVERWGAWVHDRLSWREPLPWVEPRDATHLAQLLWDPEVLFASLDVEAAIGDPLITPPGLLGITLFYRDGRPELPLMFQFYSIEKNTNWTPRPDLHLLIEVLRVWAADKNRAKVWHNGGYYDQMSLLKLLGWFKGALDTIIIMRGVYPELRRALYMAGVLTTHVGAWKLAHDDRSIALEPSSDDEWKAYNVIDTHVTGRAFLPLVQKCVERGQWPAMELDHREQHVMVQMHRIGLPVNEQKRRAKEDEQAHKILALNSQIRHIIGDPNYNPNSTHQLARLIYDDWKVPISARTDTGAPSTSEDTLRSILVSGLLDPAQHACLDQHIILREVVKEFGTYTTVYRRQDDLSPYATDPGYTDWLKNPLSFDYKNRGRPGGLTWADGRIRPDYSVHGPKTGRRSSQHPNGHNAPASIREFVEPHDLDKYTLVYADYDQIEFRLVAAIAKITSFINVFLQGGDPHSMTALLIYADEFQKQIDASYSEAERAKALAKGVPIKAKAHPTQGWEELRVFAKSFIYLVFYGGGPRTAYQNLAVARNPDTKQLLFPNMTLSDVRRAYRMIMEQAPELPAWWESVWDESQRLGYITEGLLGRRRDFPTRDPNAELNMKIQAPAAIMAARANIAVSEAIPWDFNLGTGLLTETHDSLLLMVERERAEDVKGTVERLMFCEEFGMKFTAEAKLKRSWGDR